MYKWTRLIPLGLALVLAGAGLADPPRLIEAAKVADWAAVRTLLEQGADVTVTAPDGSTALHWVSYWDDVETAELLIRRGADVNAANDLGATPLSSLDISPGSHTIRFISEGYREWTTVVEVVSGQSIRVAASLEGAR